MNIGDMGVPFIYQGEELIYPEYVKDGLVLHYDFSGMTNNDASKDIARDLSGNGNHGTLQNFNFTPESGYDKNKLLFDGVDDEIQEINLNKPPSNMTISLTMNITDKNTSMDALTWHTDIVIRVALTQGVTFIDKRREVDRYKAEYKSNESGLNTMNITVVASELKSEIYINGEKRAELLEPMNDLEINKPLRWGTFGTSYGSMELHSTKIYNRPLSPEEIAHNYAIEKERFGIGKEIVEEPKLNSLPISQAAIGKTLKVGGDK